jgi:hypothetical protein
VRPRTVVVVLVLGQHPVACLWLMIGVRSRSWRRWVGQPPRVRKGGGAEHHGRGGGAASAGVESVGDQCRRRERRAIRMR